MSSSREQGVEGRKEQKNQVRDSVWQEPGLFCNQPPGESPFLWACIFCVTSHVIQSLPSPGDSGTLDLGYWELDLNPPGLLDELGEGSPSVGLTTCWELWAADSWLVHRRLGQACICHLLAPECPHG